MQDIRNADCKTIGMVYVRALRRMGMSVEGITRFGLNQFSKRYMLHILDKNRSYQAMKYSEKVQKYAGDNILAQALSSTAYSKNPSFLSTVVAKYGFRDIPDFDRQSIVDRAEIYLKMASDIWNPNDIKNIAGG